MTEKEIKKEEQHIRMAKVLNRDPQVAAYIHEEQTALRCRCMINSILCYEDKCTIDNRYLKSYIQTLGRKRVETLISEQEEDFKKAIVLKNNFTDNEGVSYHRIIWADEISNS